jgi:hypothetical protein
MSIDIPGRYCEDRISRTIQWSLDNPNPDALFACRWRLPRGTSSGDIPVSPGAADSGLPNRDGECPVVSGASPMKENLYHG